MSEETVDSDTTEPPCADNVSECSALPEGELLRTNVSQGDTVFYVGDDERIRVAIVVDVLPADPRCVNLSVAGLGSYDAVRGYRDRVPLADDFDAPEPRTFFPRGE